MLNKEELRKYQIKTDNFYSLMSLVLSKQISIKEANKRIEDRLKEDATYLYFCHGKADKVYNVFIKSKDEGFIVYCQYGRRDKTLRTTYKTKQTVSYQEALKIYNKTILEKENKGYER